MDFDFEELDSELPGECPDIPSMSEEDFRCLGERLRSALASQDYADLDQAMAEALWVRNVPRERVRGVVRTLVDLLRELASGKRAEELPRGCALAHALFRFSLSRSMDRVSLGPREPGAHVALILGAAGDDAEEASPRSDAYEARGLATIAACRCVFPAAFQRYQEVQLAAELQECLVKGARLIVHLCGRHGHGTWCHVASLWHRRQKPYHRLAPLQDVLAGVVWECGPPAELPAGGSAQAGGGAAQEPCEEKPLLTLEQALSMQRELYAQFSKDKFMDRLEDLEESHKKGSAKFIAARNKLFLEVQAPIIVKYGFEGTHKGVMQMLAAAARWNGHADYRRNVDRLNCLLGINAEGSKEHSSRVEVAQKDQAAARETSKQQAQPHLENGDVIQYPNDATGMAACADACLRSLLAQHLPEISQGKFLLEIKEYVMGAASRGAFWMGDDYALKTDIGQPLWGTSADWIAIDSAMQPRVPRLFLHSKTDKVVPPEVVETHLRIAEEQQSHAGDVIQQEVQGAHMRLWQSNRPACERAVAALLKKAGVLKG